MTMAPPPAQKFLFNRTFDGAALEGAKAKEATPTFSQAELEVATEAARQQGHAEGMAAATQSQAAQALAMATRIEQRIEQAFAQAAVAQRQDQTDLTEIVLAIARKLLPPFAAETALTTIQAMLTAACRDLGREPRLVVRVHDSMLDGLKKMLDGITQQQAYAGKIVLLADEALQPADCRIEWSDGGLEHDSAALWQQIDAAVQRAQQVRRQSAGTEPHETSIEELPS